jgi:hypothetical protein
MISSGKFKRILKELYMTTDKDQKSETESDSLNEQGAMPRRNVLLGGAGATATVLLGACGGGDELDGSLPQYTEIRSEVAAYILPKLLLPVGGRYQVEVVFATQDQVSVAINDGVDGNIRKEKVIATKARREGLHHIINYAAYKIDGFAGRDLTAAMLRVTQITVNSAGTSTIWTTVVGAGSGATTETYQSEFVERRVYADSSQIEYRFYTKHPAGNKGLICVVRFFLRGTEDAHLTFAPGEYVRTVANNASVAAITRTSGTLLRSAYMSTTFSRPKFESQALKDPKGTHSDTIVLTDRQRGDGQYMLVPTLHHASSALRPFIAATLRRSLTHLGKSLATTQPLDGEEDVNQSNFLHNELMRLVGGESLIENMQKKRDDFVAKVDTLFGNMGSAMANFIKTSVSDELSPEVEAEATRLLAEAESAYSGDTRFGGILFANTIALQVAASLQAKNYPLPGLAAGVGLRFSIPLVIRTVVNGKNFPRKLTRWRINADLRSTFKFSVVFIVKFISEGALAVDLEITLNFAVNGTHVMIESMVFDPVIDVDTRDYLSAMWTRLLNAAANAASSDLGSLIKHAQNFEKLAEILTNDAERSAQALAPVRNLASGALPEYPQHVLSRTVTEFTKKTEKYRFEVLEGSFFRLKWMHKNIGTPPSATIPLWLAGAFGYNPGAKKILGIGPRLSIPVTPQPVAPSEPDVVVSGYGRVAYIADFGIVHGTNEFLTHSGLVLNI